MSSDNNIKFKVILADPPWTYSNNKDNLPKYGGKTYKTMTMKELKTLPIQDIVDPQCYLFLWATMPKLPEALELMKAWGFEYKTCAFVWVKLNPKNKEIYSGLGHFVNGNCELVLLGRRKGVKMLPRINKNVKQVILAPRGRHSEKPQEVKKRIVDLLGDDIPKLEMFARKKFDDKWHYHGLEVDADIVL